MTDTTNPSDNDHADPTNRSDSAGADRADAGTLASDNSAEGDREDVQKADKEFGLNRDLRRELANELGYWPATTGPADIAKHRRLNAALDRTYDFQMKKQAAIRDGRYVFFDPRDPYAAINKMRAAAGEQPLYDDDDYQPIPEETTKGQERQHRDD